MRKVTDNDVFMELAEESGFVWSTPMSFCESYNKGEDGTDPEKYVLRIIVDSSSPDDPSYEYPVYFIRREYYQGEVVADPYRIFSEQEGWQCPDFASMVEGFNSLTDAYGDELMPRWDNVLMMDSMDF